MSKHSAASRRKKPSIRKRPQAKETPVDPKSFDWAIERFIGHIESVSRTAVMTRKTMDEALKKETEQLVRFAKEKGVRTVGKCGRECYRIKFDDFAIFKRHEKDLASCIIAVRSVPRIFFCALVHQYDAYLGRLLRAAFLVQPDSLRTSQWQLSFAEMLAMGSMDAAREYLVEKEVEAVIRDGHVAHFDWMEKQFGLPLRKELAVWPVFVELTERRNLFVHCDGVVSSQYLKVCQKHCVKFDRPVAVGDELDVSPEYFQRAVECVLEVGIKLGHVLWRKLQPGSLKDADKALHLAMYELLCEERYSLAKTLLDFAVNTLKKQSCDEIRRINLVNLAIARSFSGERKEALALLKGEDWSASEDKFKLAVAVLERRYAAAVQLMKEIGSKGSVRRVDYCSWPLFKEFRHTQKFQSAYRALFGKDFVLPKSESGGLAAKQVGAAKVTGAGGVVRGAPAAS